MNKHSDLRESDYSSNKLENVENNVYICSIKTINMPIKIGTTVGNWIVTSERFKKDKIYWNTCKCICGKIRDVKTWSLNNSKTKGCGCSNTISRFRFEGIGDLSKAYYSSFKRSRESKNIPFSENITLKYLWNLFLKQDKKCALSGLEIILNPRYSFQKSGKLKNESLYQTASIDRINNSIGYIDGNVQWVHKDVNYMRGGLKIEDFLFICNKISLNNKGITNNINNFNGKRLYFNGKSSTKKVKEI